MIDKEITRLRAAAIVKPICVSWGDNTLSPNLPPASNLEKTAIVAILVFMLGFRLAMAFHLNRIGLYEKFDVLMDTDPNLYVGAISHGWSFGREVHPAFGLLFNVPTRAIDFLMAYFDLLNTGVIRSLAPVIFAPLVSSFGSFVWWLAAQRAGFSAQARLAGFLISQIAFSQTVFSVIPESYSLSGSLLCVLLLLSVNAARTPEKLNSGRVRAQWLALACIMAGITVTNGFLCIAVWVAIRARPKQLRRAIFEGAAAVVVVSLAIATFITLDRLVYQPEKQQAGTTQALPEVRATTGLEELSIYARRFGSPIKALENAVAFPAHLLASIFSPPVETVSLFYGYGLSIESSAKSWTRLTLAWLFALGAMVLVARNKYSSTVVRAIISVILFNTLLHSVFGTETFLYSQHWLAFLVFAVILPFSGRSSTGSNLVMTAIVLSALLCNVGAWLEILENVEPILRSR